MKRSFTLGFYLVFGMVNIGILAFGIYNINNVIKIYQYSESINLLFHHTSSMNNAVQKYLVEEVRDSNYYKTNQSQSLETYHKYFGLLAHETKKIGQSAFAKNFNITQDVHALAKNYSTFDDNFKAIVAQYRYKGYKDFGQEGYMRRNIHYLESMQDILPLAHILKLRRHEKDYLLRKDSSYISKLKKETLELKTAIAKARTSSTTATLLFSSLSNYENSFLKIVRATSEIERLQDLNLRLMSEQLHPALSRLMQCIKTKKEKLISNCIRDFVILSIIFLTSTCIIGYKLHHYQSQYLEDVETYLKNIRKGDFSNQVLAQKLQQIPSMKKIGKHLQRIEASQKKHKHCIPSPENRPTEPPTEASLVTAVSKNFSKLI